MESSKKRTDSLASSISTNDTDILSDMIPYRCPKCGNQRKFLALRDLKLHLDVEHSFKMGCVKPRSRNDVFNHKTAKEKPLVTSGKYVKTKHGGRFSPRSTEESHASMLKYYDDEAKRLEMKVKMAKETEIKNKLNRNILPKSREDNPKGSPASKGDNFTHSFNNINNQLLKSRHKEWRATEALYQAEDIIQGVEEAAENRCLDQQVVIRDLVNDLRQKEGQLSRANNDLDKVRRERESLLLEVEELFSEANTGNTVLREELGRREHMLGDVNRQLDTLRTRARIDLDRKEGELIAAEGRVEALEKERERLVQGTNTLLEQADKDRATLQQTVQTKERQLRQVNEELDKLKIEQGDLVQESIGLYQKANEGTARLQHLVQAKDNQLQEAFQELESMKNVHEKLIWQSKTLTEQADSSNQALTELLQSKENELELAKQNLAKVKESNDAAFQNVLAEKEAELAQSRDELAKIKAEMADMLESVKDLTQKASNQDVKMTDLHKQVQHREQALQEKERDLDSLKKFLSSAAEKEVVARSKIEQFISGLIDRADKAESELHKIKTRSMSEVDLSRSQTLGDVSNVLESDKEAPRSPRHSQTIRARSQDSSIKSLESNKLQMNYTPTDNVLRGQNANEFIGHKSSQHADKNAPPWQKILRKNCLSDSYSSEESDMEILNTESDFDERAHEGHQITRSDHTKVVKNGNKHNKKAASQLNSLLVPHQHTVADTTSRPSPQMEGYGQYHKDKDAHPVMDSRVLGDNVRSKHLSPGMEREDGVFHFGQTNNEEPETHGSSGNSSRSHISYSKLPGALPSQKPHVSETRNVQQFSPQTLNVNSTTPVSGFNGHYNSVIPESSGNALQKSLATDMYDQTTLAMVHPPPLPMVHGREFARRQYVPRSKSESDLKHTNNSQQRSLQLNQQFRDSYLTAPPVELNEHNDYRDHSHNSFQIMAPGVRNFPVPQHRQIDIPSYTADSSYSQRHPMGPFSNVTGQSNIATDISNSQCNPIGTFTKFTGHENKSMEISNSERHPIGPFAKVTGQSNIATDISKSHGHPIGPFAKVTGHGNTVDDVSTSQRYPIGPFVKPANHNSNQNNFSTPQMFCGGEGQGHLSNNQSHVISGFQSHLTNNVRSGQSYSGHIGGIQQGQGQTIRSEEHDQSFGSESRRDGHSSGHAGQIMYIPVDTRTGQPVNVSTVSHGIPYSKSSESQQTPKVPDHFGVQRNGIQSRGSEVTGSRMTNNPPSMRHPKGVTSSTFDQSQNLISSQQPPQSQERKYETGQQTSQPEGSMRHEPSRSSPSAVVDGNGDHDNSLSDVLSLVDYELDVEEPDDIESAAFEQFMDEHGILWELSETSKNQPVIHSLRDSSYHSSHQLTNDAFSHQTEYGTVRKEESEILHNSGRSLPNQRLHSRSKSAEIGPRDKLSPHVRNRSLSPRVRFSDQTQYWPNPDDVDNETLIRQRSSNPLCVERNSGFQSEVEVFGQSSGSVTDSKPDFEELWLRDVSLGTTTASVESFVPVQKRSSRTATNPKSTIKPPGHKDQGCQPLKDSSTQTWLLDFPLTIDDLGSVTQRSSFVRPRIPKDSVTLSSTSSNASTSRRKETIMDNHKAEPPCILSSDVTSTPISDSNRPITKGKDTLDTIRGTAMSTSECQKQSVNQTQSDQSLSSSSATNPVYNIPLQESYRPASSSENGNGRVYHSKRTRRHFKDDKDDRSRDSGSSVCKEVDRYDRHSQSGTPFEEKRTSKLKNIQDRKNTQCSDSDFTTRDDIIGQSQRSRSQRERKTNLSPDNTYKQEQSTDSQYTSDNYEEDEYRYKRDRREGRSKPNRYSRDNRSMSPKSTYKNGEAEDTYNSNRRDTRKSYKSTNSRHREKNRDEYFDEYEDSQDKWTDDHEYKGRRHRYDRRHVSKPKNTYDEMDRRSKKGKSKHRKNSSRYGDCSNSYSDSQDSVVQSRSTNASQNTNQVDTSVKSGHTEPGNSNNDRTMTNTEKASKLSDISMASETVKTLSNASTSLSEVINPTQDENSDPRHGNNVETIKDVCDNNYHYPSSNEDQIAEKRESVLYENSELVSTEQQHINDNKEIVGNHVHVVMDTDDQYSMYSIGSSSLSRTSSQESLLEHIPKSRREAVRQRRLSLYLVFRYLDTKTLGRVAGVNREWKKVSRQSSLWKHVHLSNTRCTSKTLETLARWCTQLESLHLEDVYTRKQLELESDEDYTQAVRASLEAGVECLLQVSESTLKSVTIINCQQVLTDKCMWLASCYSRMLQDVRYHSNIHILGADVLWALGAGCGLIRSLDIAPLYPCTNTEKFTNKCLQIIAQFLPELDRLCIGGKHLDVNGFVLIAKSCQRLYGLSLHGCVDVEEDVSIAICRKGLKNLRSLNFIHTPVTDKALLHFYSSCKHLKSIHVSFCPEDITTDPDSKEIRENFNKRVKSLEKLKKKGGLWNILKLEVHKVQD